MADPEAIIQESSIPIKIERSASISSNVGSPGKLKRSPSVSSIVTHPDVNYLDLYQVFTLTMLAWICDEGFSSLQEKAIPKSLNRCLILKFGYKS